MTRDLEPAVVVGEIVTMVEHALCGVRHPVIDGWMACCCGDDHAVNDFICCECGHHHDLSNGRCLPAGPCGSFICCIP